MIRKGFSLTGKVIGTVIGGSVNVIGEMTDSKFIKDVGQGVKSSTEFAADTLGQAVEGIVETASGIVQDNPNQIKSGMSDVGDSFTRTVKGVGVTLANTIENGLDIVEGVKSGDNQQVKDGLKSIGKTVAIGTLAVGMIEFTDGLESISNDLDNAEGTPPSHTEISKETPSSINEVHYVEPHWVDGHWRGDTWVDGYWRDGDGDSSTNLNAENGGGYLRSNPDGISSNNLNS
ncbi:hypothetical protein [Exiguobacterium aurantiacum]|uniref:hypothetical protein n=1 Tax=Exiguobacterium aurantiacum TaxID=33987 RepID=UPI003CFEC5F8